jgi:hypothetical protein
MTSLKRSHSALYRAFQFFAALKANWGGGNLADADQALVNAILTSPAQRQLFKRMSANDQRHAVAVARTLQQANHTEPALLQAALLHDIAKSLGQPIIHRVLIVLLNRFWPALLTRISEWQMANGELSSYIDYPCPAGYSPFAHSPIPTWRCPFIVHAHHPAIGAAWVSQAGGDPLLVQLIARHQDHLPSHPTTAADKLLAALQWADNLN